MNEGVRQNLVFQDETGFNIWTSRTRGRAVRILEGQRGRNLTISMAVSPVHGLVHHNILDGGMNCEKFASFLSEVSELLADEQDVVILIDNAPAHADAEFELPQHQLLRRLPKYSPFLNMTELANSALKAAVKRQLTDPVVQARIHNREEAAAAGMTLQAHRLNILKNIVIESLPTITPQKCRGWFQHCLTYTMRCLNQEDILF